MSAPKSRFAWLTSFALCGALVGCGQQAAEEPAPVAPGETGVFPGMPGDDTGGMDRSGEMRGMPGGAVSAPPADTTAPAEPAPIEPPVEEPTPVEPPADAPAPVEPPADAPAPAEPTAGEAAPVEPAPAEPTP